MNRATVRSEFVVFEWIASKAGNSMGARSLGEDFGSYTFCFEKARVTLVLLPEC